MSNSIIKKKNLILCLKVITFPFIMIGIEIGIKVLLNSGTYLGTFLRNLYELVVQR